MAEFPPTSGRAQLEEHKTGTTDTLTNAQYAEVT
jgi:hypothetical protein